VTRWLKQVGDEVAVDEPLLEISTDKVDTEIPSPVAGTLQEILVAEDETVAVGAVLARIGSAPRAAAPAAAEALPGCSAGRSRCRAAALLPLPLRSGCCARSRCCARTAAAAPAPAAAPADDATTYVTPLVRRLAQQQGVDLASVTGTGSVVASARKTCSRRPRPPGRTRAAAVAPAPAAPAPLEVSPLRGTTQPMSRLRKVLAERAVASMQQTAQLTTVVKVDVTKVASYRTAVQKDFVAKTGGKLSFLPFFVLAAAEALQAFPVINATVDGTDIVYPATENISIAVDTERGLLTPVLRDAGTKTLAGISSEIADLAARTRDNKLKPDELAGGTFTVTNTGSRGALFDTPVVFLPVRDPRHRRGRQGTRCGEGRRRRGDRRALLCTWPVVRSPHRRRRGRGPLPRRGQDSPRDGTSRPTSGSERTPCRGHDSWLDPRRRTRRGSAISRPSARERAPGPAALRR
jgi:2-oxoglutarate dehydrogenase E2 component (dihydrolipoamide succinyltransferase)